MTMLLVSPGQRLHAQDLTPLDRIAAAEIDGIRWGPRWDAVERVLGGGYDWTATDAVMDALERLGLLVIFTVAGRDNANNEHAVEYARYFDACVERYGHRAHVVAFEAGNEPNHFIWSGVPSAAGYTALLKRTYDLVKPKHPSIMLITAGMGGAKNDVGDGDATDFVAGMYAAGARGYFDALTYHPYSKGYFRDSIASGTGGANRMRESRKVMVANGDKAKQIWVTEFGVSTGGTKEHVTEQEQAAILEENVRWMLGHKWVGPMSWFNHVDDPNPDPLNSGDFRGLWRKDWTPKPALATFTRMATLLEAT